MFSQSYRVKRVFSFLFPSLDPVGMNYQVSNSLKAIKAGGLFGVGLGNGQYKLGLLPEVQSDFIFASICEEIGFVGSAFILILFAMIAILGYNAASRCRAATAFSASVLSDLPAILFQAILNLAVVTALLPPTVFPCRSSARAVPIFS
jgi:cell division protein FtsW